MSLSLCVYVCICMCVLSKNTSDNHSRYLRPMNIGSINISQPKTKKQICGLSSVGRASALQAEGQDFDYPSLQTPPLNITQIFDGDIV